MRWSTARRRRAPPALHTSRARRRSASPRRASQARASRSQRDRDEIGARPVRVNGDATVRRGRHRALVARARVSGREDDSLMTPMTSIAMDAVMTATCCACNVELTSQSHRAPAASHATTGAARYPRRARRLYAPPSCFDMSSRRRRSSCSAPGVPPPVPRPARLHAATSPSPPAESMNVTNHRLGLLSVAYCYEPRDDDSQSGRMIRSPRRFAR